MRKICIGVIADDFTGASDAASFLAKNGYKTILLTDVPKTVSDLECDCVVTAQKIRSVEPKKAISQIETVYRYYQSLGIEKIYYKYCSTFDSTPKGNIGVVSDWLLEKIKIPFTVLCPSLPVNGRTVKDGILYVNGIPLAESPMKNHPLNPMWDSYIPNLMAEQSHYPCHVLKREEFKLVNKKIKEWMKISPFYVVPDFETQEDGLAISKMFTQLPLLTGGSGLLEYLLPKKRDGYHPDFGDQHEKSILLCGSCSAMTKKQVNRWIMDHHLSIAIHSKDVLVGAVKPDKIISLVMSSANPTLIYSDGISSLNHSDETFADQAKAMENFFAELSYLALKNGYTRIIVAGGETSGAVTLKLGYKAYELGKSISPGVPELKPLENPNIVLVLKSGNFGSEDFFERAINPK